jgi:hypothetical protein
VRTDVAGNAHPQPEDLAVGIQRQFGMVDLVAAVVACEKLLGAAGAPVHRPAELARGIGADHVFRVELGFHAESAADIADPNPDLLQRQLQHPLGQCLLQAGRVLAAGMQGDAVGLCVVLADAAARFHADRHQPLVVQIDSRDMLGFGERRIAGLGVAKLRLRRDIARRLVPDERRAGRGGRLDGDHARQLLVLDHHLFGGIQRLQPRLRDHRGQRFAHVIDHADRQRVVRRRRHRLAVGALQPRVDRQRTDAIGLQLLAGQDRKHPRKGLGRPGIDRHDARARMRRAHERNECLALRRQIVDVGPRAVKQPLVLAAGDGLTDTVLCHVDIPVSSMRAAGAPDGWSQRLQADHAVALCRFYDTSRHRFRLIRDKGPTSIRCWPLFPPTRFPEGTSPCQSRSP